MDVLLDAAPLEVGRHRWRNASTMPRERHRASVRRKREW
jgi:hypothetical protein